MSVELVAIGFGTAGAAVSVAVVDQEAALGPDSVGCQPFGQNGKLNFRNNVLKRIVAFANTGGGIIFVGVEEEGERRPGAVVGIDKDGSAPNKDPESAIQNTCASKIEPHVRLETAVVAIPAGQDGTGNRVLQVIRAASLGNGNTRSNLAATSGVVAAPRRPAPARGG